MKHVFLFALLWASVVVASPTAGQFLVDVDGLPVGQAIQQIYTQLGRQIALSPDLPAKAVTAHLSVAPDQIDSTLDALWAQAGVVRQTRNGVEFFGPGTADPQPYSAEIPPELLSAGAVPTPSTQVDVVEFYRPRYRSPAGLQKIADAVTGHPMDPSVDQVVVAGTRQTVDAAMSALRAADQKNSSVVIRAALLEYTDENTRSSGFGLAIDALRGNLKSVLGAVSVQSDFLRIGGGDVQAVVQAVSGDSRFALLSQPLLRVKNGQKGRVQVGDSTPVLSSTTVQDDGDRSQSIEYRDSGVILEAQPVVLGDSVELTLSQEVSSFQKNRSSGIDSPVLSQRRLSTVIDTRVGETIILAGLNAQNAGQGSSGFSLLPDWAKTRTKSDSSRQILLVLSVEPVQ